MTDLRDIYGFAAPQAGVPGLALIGDDGSHHERTSRRVILKLVEAGIWLAAHVLTAMALLAAMVSREPAVLALSAAAFPIYGYAISIVHSATKLATARRLWWLPALAIAMMFIAGLGANPDEPAAFFGVSALLVATILVIAYLRFVRPMIRIISLNGLLGGEPGKLEIESPTAGLSDSWIQVAIELIVAGFAFIFSLLLLLSALS